MPEASTIDIRAEIDDDRAAIRGLNLAAFGGDDEGALVDTLRGTDAFIPELSLVAVADDCPIGHILITRACIECATQEVPAVALAPMAVLPEWQRRGIGSRLARRAIEDSTKSGHTLMIVLGHPEFYPRFDFVPASRFGINAPFDVRDEVFMALWLDQGQERVLDGVMRYAAPFRSVGA